jgi:hypothetical protein
MLCSLATRVFLLLPESIANVRAVIPTLTRKNYYRRIATNYE